MGSMTWLGSNERRDYDPASNPLLQMLIANTMVEGRSQREWEREAPERKSEEATRVLQRQMNQFLLDTSMGAEDRRAMEQQDAERAAWVAPYQQQYRDALVKAEAAGEPPEVLSTIRDFQTQRMVGAIQDLKATDPRMHARFTAAGIHQGQPTPRLEEPTLANVMAQMESLSTLDTGKAQREAFGASQAGTEETTRQSKIEFEQGQAERIKGEALRDYLNDTLAKGARLDRAQLDREGIAHGLRADTETLIDEMGAGITKVNRTLFGLELQAADEPDVEKRTVLMERIASLREMLPQMALDRSALADVLVGTPERSKPYQRGLTFEQMTGLKQTAPSKAPETSDVTEELNRQGAEQAGKAKGAGEAKKPPKEPDWYDAYLQWGKPK